MHGEQLKKAPKTRAGPGLVAEDGGEKAFWILTTEPELCNPQASPEIPQGLGVYVENRGYIEIKENGNYHLGFRVEG